MKRVFQFVALLLVLGCPIVVFAQGRPPSREESKKPHKWSDTIFTEPFILRVSRFPNQKFDNSVFRETAVFDSVRFFGSTSFVGTHFNEQVSFDSTKFDSVDITAATFDADVNFSRAVFFGEATVYQSRFQGSAVFDHAWFRRGAQFIGDTFSAGLSFRFVVCSGTLWFSNVRFDGPVDFTGMRLPDTLGIDTVEIASGILDLTSCYPPRSGRKCHLFLRSTDLDMVKFDLIRFSLEPADTVFMNISGETWYKGPDFRNAFYEQLLAKFRREGLNESYKIADIDYQKWNYSRQGKIGAVKNALQRCWWEYGYAKHRILFWTPGLWLFLSIIAFFFYGKLTAGVYVVPFLESRFLTAQGPIEAVFVRFWLAAVYTGFIFFSLKMSSERFKPGAIRHHWLLFSYLMSVFAVGILCLGFLANFVFTH